jgi:hypothetical protein
MIAAVERSVGTPSLPSTGATPCTITALMAALDRARTERPPSPASRSAAARGGHEHAPQAPHDRTATTMLILPRATSVRRVALMTTLTICSTSSRSGTCSESRGSEGDAAAGDPTFLGGGGGGCCNSCCTKFLMGGDGEGCCRSCWRARCRRDGGGGCGDGGDGDGSGDGEGGSTRKCGGGDGGGDRCQPPLSSSKASTCCSLAASSSAASRACARPVDQKLLPVSDSAQPESRARRASGWGSPCVAFQAPSTGGGEPIVDEEAPTSGHGTCRTRPMHSLLRIEREQMRSAQSRSGLSFGRRAHL